MKTLTEVFEALVNKMQQFDLYTMNPRDEVALALDELKDKIDEVEKRMVCVSKTQKDIYNTIREYTTSVDGEGEKKHITLQHHDVIQYGCYDIEASLDMSNDTCIVDNWYNLFEPNYEHLIGKTYIVTETIHDGIKGCIFKILDIEINVDNEVVVKSDIQDPSVFDLACLMWLNIDEVSEYEEPIAVGRIEYDFPQSVFTIANEDNTEIVCDVYEDDFNKLCSMGMIRFLLEEGDEERFSVKGNCSDYLLKSNEFISITKKREIDLTTVPIIKEPIPQTVSEEPRPLPKCVKINGKVFLYGSERYEVVINDNDLGMIELFDMTTEMETGDSYSMFVSDISFFEVASDEERQAVDAFFIKSQLELFPN